MGYGPVATASSSSDLPLEGLSHGSGGTVMVHRSGASMTARRTFPRILTVVVVMFSLAACSSDDDPAARGGHDSARAALDAHVDAARTYDLETDCNLRTPDRRSEMAAFDGLEAETYCETVTAPIMDAADDETRERSRAIYTDPTVTDLDRPGGTWFSVVSADGNYAEAVETVAVDGRWWIAIIDSDVIAHGDDHALEGDEPVPPEARAPEADGSTPTADG